MFQYVTLVAVFIFTSTHVFSATPDCGLPSCNISDITESLKGMAQNERYAKMGEYNQIAATTQNLNTLRFLKDLGQKLKIFFDDIHEEYGLVSSAIQLTSQSVSSLLKQPLVTDEERLSLFSSLDKDDNSRFSIITDWTKSDTITAIKDTPTLESKKTLLIGCANNCIAVNCPKYTSDQAQYGVDLIVEQILLAFHVPMLDQKRDFHDMKSEQARFNTMSALMAKVSANPPPTDDLLKEYVELANFGAADSQGMADWVAGQAKALRMASSDRLVRRLNAPISEMNYYFKMLENGPNGDGDKIEVLRFWRNQLAKATDRATVEKMNQFFQFAKKDSVDVNAADYVKNEAQYGVEDTVEKVLLNFFKPDFNIDPSELIVYFRQIENRGSASQIMGHLIDAFYQNYLSETFLFGLADFIDPAIEYAHQLEPDGSDGIAISANILRQNVFEKALKRTDVDVSKMIKYYSNADDHTRSVVIFYWQFQIPNLNRDQLTKITAFLNLALADNLETVIGDNGSSHTKASEWVIAATQNTLRLIGLRIAEVSPIFEGSYQVIQLCGETTCEKTPIDRLILMNTLGNEGVKAYLVNGKLGTVLYQFPNLDITGGITSFDSITHLNGALAHVHLNFDLETRNIEGFIHSTDMQGDFVFRALHLTSLADIYQGPIGQTRIGQSDLKGSYSGEYGGKPARLKITTLQSGQTTLIAADLTLAGIQNFHVSFQMGHFEPMSQVLILVSQSTSGSLFKAALGVYFTSDQSIQLTGLGLGSQNGLTEVLSFKKTQ